MVSSHPLSVREEIERHRQAIDRNPVLALKHGSDMPAKVAAAGLHVALRATSYVRLAPSLVNSPTDVDAALTAVRSLARG